MSFTLEIMDSFLHNSTTFYHKIIDLQGNYCYFNELYLLTFNFSNSVKLGGKCLNLVFKDDLSIIQNCLQKLISKELQICTLKIRKKTSKSKFVWTEWEYSTILNANNEIIGFNCIGYKKTDNNDIDLFVHELTDNINGVITELKVKEDLSYNWQFLSDGVENLYEINLKQAKKNPNIIYDLIVNEDFEKSKVSFMNAIKNSIPYFIQHRITTPSGKRKWVEISSIPKKQKDKSTIWHGFHQDITEKKELEQANRKNEFLLEQLTEGLNGGLIQSIIHNDKKIELTYLSDGIFKIGELTQDEINQNPQMLFDLIHPEDKESVIEAIFNASITLKPYKNEYRIITKSGKTKWIKVNASPKLAQNDAVLNNAFYEDITKQKQQEIEIIKNQNLLTNLTNNLKCVVYQLRMVSEKKLNYDFIGENLKLLFEVDFLDVKKDPFILHKMILEQDTKMVSIQIDTAFKTLKQFSTQHRIKVPSGKTKWIEAHAMPQKQSDGSVVFYGFFNDITAIKTLEFENLKAQEQLKNLTNNIKGVLTQFKIDDRFNISWEYLSKGVEEIYEMDFAYIKKNQKKFESLIDASDLKKTNSDFQKAIANKSTFKSQYRITTPSGILKWVEVNSHPVENQDKTITWFGFDIDITEKKKIEIENLKIQTTLKNLTNNLNGVVSIFKVFPDGNRYNWEYLSKGVENLYEVTFDYVKQHNDCIAKMIHPDFMAETIDKVKHSIKTMTTLTHLRKIITPSGVEKWVEVNSIPEIQPDGSCFFHGFHADVTLRKTLEIEQEKNAKIIIENERFLKNITDNVQGMLTMARIDSFEGYTLEFVSKGMESLYDMSFNDFKKDKSVFFNMVNPADLKLVKAKMENCIKTISPMFLQYRILTPLGKKKWIEVSSYPHKQANDTIIWYGFHSDITETKKLEIENLINEEKLKFIVDNASSSIIMFENNKVSFISNNYQKIFGFSVAEETHRLNTYIWDIIAEEDENKANIKNQLHLAVKEQQKQITIQYKYLHKNGNLIWRKDEISFFYDENGRVSKAVELVSDITEKKNLENLVLNQNLQLALQIEENEKISENFLAFQSDKWLEISQNLHDNISQLLFAANLHLNNFNSKDVSLTKANGLIKMALDEIKFVTQSTKNLLIQNKGLENALTELIENNNYLKNISITKKIHSDFYKRFSNSEQIILFTIIQEAMQNAIKHSEGTTIKIVLDIKNGHYYVSIKDNGVGLKQNFINGMGVYNIKKNVNLLNGTIKYLNRNGLELLIEFL